MDQPFRALLLCGGAFFYELDTASIVKYCITILCKRSIAAMERGVSVFTLILYALGAMCLFVSFVKDRQKTYRALKKAWMAFENILPQFSALLLIIGMSLSVLDAQTVSRFIGAESGVLGMLIAAVVGSVTLIPGFVAFPLAASLLRVGAGYGQVTMLLTTMMMVGVVTLPVEAQYLGKTTALRRNLYAFVFAVGVSFLIGAIIK